MKNINTNLKNEILKEIIFVDNENFSKIKSFTDLNNFIKTNNLKLNILGFGEISTVVEVKSKNISANFVYKKLPPFENLQSVKKYEKVFYKYCALLKFAGINLPLAKLLIFKKSSAKYSIYVKQKKLNPETIGNNLIHNLSPEKCLDFLQNIFLNLLKIYKYNLSQDKIKIGLDGQISNWAYYKNKIYYIDITSPLFRINNKEQLDIEIFLKTTPFFLRPVIKKFFLKQVLDRYYDLRLVCVDLIANFFKEQKKEIVTDTIKLANNFLTKNINEKFTKITFTEVKKYYDEDAFIWKFYQFARKVDKQITTKILRKNYEIILPEKIKR